MAFARFALAVAVSFGTALAFYSALRLPRRQRSVLLLCAAAIILLCPLVVPPPARFLRFLASVLAVTFAVKLFDLHIGAHSGVRPGLLHVIVFHWNVFSLVDRRIDARPDPLHRAPLRRLGLSATATVAAAALAVAVFRADWSTHSFVLEHAVKVVTFFLVLVPFSIAAGVVWRLFGGPGRDIMNNPFAARTPADFWRRYNRPVHEFLEEDVFKPAAGPGAARRRKGRAWGAAMRATILTFIVSAAIHEYVFAIPIGRVQGYQTAFFLLQGLAVGATLRVKPRGWRVVPWVIATFAFNLAAGVLFFASLNHVVPLYQHRPPLWDE